MQRITPVARNGTRSTTLVLAARGNPDFGVASSASRELSTRLLDFGSFNDEGEISSARWSSPSSLISLIG